MSPSERTREKEFEREKLIKENKRVETKEKIIITIMMMIVGGNAEKGALKALLLRLVCVCMWHARSV